MQHAIPFHVFEYPILSAMHNFSSTNTVCCLIWAHVLFMASTLLFLATEQVFFFYCTGRQVAGRVKNRKTGIHGPRK